jgi:hypothetical protein
MFHFTYSCCICGKPTHTLETGCVTVGDRRFNYSISYCGNHTPEEKQQARLKVCEK